MDPDARFADAENQTSETQKQQTSLDVLRQLDAGSKSTPDEKDGAAVRDGDWARAEIGMLRSSAMDTKTIFSFCFVCNHNDVWSTAYGCVMMIVAMFIQTVIPIVIIATLQPISDIDTTEGMYSSKACPNRSNGLTKTIGFFLCLYFITLTISLCTNKLRGLGFLKEFVDLGKWREMIVVVAIASNFLGMGAAGGAQYLLFIGNGGKSYVILLLQSLAMQFCLTVDQRLVSDVIGKRTAARLGKVTRDELLCNGVGIGAEGEVCPAEIMSRVKKLVDSEKVVLAMVSIVGILWSVALAVCM